MPNKILKEIQQTRPFATCEEEATVNVLRTADALKRGVELLLKRHGLTLVQYNVLRILQGAGPGGTTCSGIGLRLITSEPDVTRLLNRMENRGWLARARDGHDRRVVKTLITERGQRLLAEVSEPLKELQARQFQRLSQRDVNALIGGLEKVRESISSIPS